MTELKWLMLCTTIVIVLAISAAIYSTTITMIKQDQVKELYLYCLEMQKTSDHNLYCRN
jgi:hypothetical protein